MNEPAGPAPALAVAILTGIGFVVAFAALARVAD
jgi:hypothetical protein